MKNNIRLFMVAALAASISFTSCKKEDKTVGNEDTELSIHAEDQARVADESDEIANEANSVIDGYDAFNGRPPIDPVNNILCNGTAVIDSNATTKTITITYNGLNCIGNRTRVGVVLLSMPRNMRWRDVGAVMTITVQNLRITRVRDNKSITINGIKTITNVTGGRLRDLAGVGPITHDVATQGQGMNITFDNGSQRTWQVARRRVFTYNNGIVITVMGTRTDGAVNNISDWGTNRFGNSFVTSITAPIVIRQDCNFRVVGGEVKHQRLIADIVTTFGLDATGLPTTCPAGVYYFKTVWTGTNGVIRTVILPY